MAGTPVEAIKQIIYDNDINSGSGISEDLAFKLASSVMWIMQNSADYVGKVEYAMMSEEDFAVTKGYSLVDESSQPLPEAQKKWILLKKQDITGSDYANKFGITQVSEDLVAKRGHLGQAGNSSQIMTYEASQNKEHNHPLIKNLGQVNGVNGVTAIDYQDNGSFDTGNRGYSYNDLRGQDLPYIQPDGGDQSHPNRILTNIFLRINN